MTIKLQSSLAAQIRSLVGVVVAIPVVALIGYPLYHLSLSEARRELADLPQDLILVLMAEAIVVPLFLLIRHRWARSRYWLVSDAGIEVVGPGARTALLRWAAVKSLTAEGGTVTLLPCEGGAVHRLLWVDSKSAAAALQTFSTQK
jgi:hypothetical protein